MSRRKGDNNFSSYRYSKEFYQAIKKYGAENVVSEVLYVCRTADEADRLEKLAISRYNTIIPNGYNIEQGGKRNKAENKSNGKNEPEKEDRVFDIFASPLNIFGSGP